jgi:1-acyl-sn-glycerol-3-phosphate acyltransferase
MIALHLLRVILHLLQGMATCAFVFPLAGPAMRERRIRNWSHRLLAICGVRLVVKGALSDSPALIVCNHVSWLDIFAVNTCRPCRFVAKSDIRDWPLIGWLCDRAGTIFIARGRQRDVRRIFQGLVTSIHAGERVAFFPEGTVSLQGTVLPFMPTCSRRRSMPKCRCDPTRCVTWTAADGRTRRWSMLAIPPSYKAC